METTDGRPATLVGRLSESRQAEGAWKEIDLVTSPLTRVCQPLPYPSLMLVRREFPPGGPQPNA